MTTFNDLKNQIAEATDLSDVTKKALGIATVSDTGMLHWGPLDQYMSAFDVDEDTADELLGDVSDELVNSDVCTDIAGSLYLTEALEEIDGAEAEAMREHTDYVSTVNAAWNAAKGIR
jgi:hypothetical protein